MRPFWRYDPSDGTELSRRTGAKAEQGQDTRIRGVWSPASHPARTVIVARTVIDGIFAPAEYSNPAIPLQAGQFARVTARHSARLPGLGGVSRPAKPQTFLHRLFAQAGNNLHQPDLNIDPPPHPSPQENTNNGLCNCRRAWQGGRTGSLQLALPIGQSAGISLSVRFFFLLYIYIPFPSS